MSREPSTEYDAVHNRLRRDYGPARTHPCAAPDCDAPAAVWAWQRTGPSRAGLDRNSIRVTWGTDPADYAPMCRSHATMLDRGGTLTHCPNGHNRAEHGATTQGVCRACLRTWRAERARERWATDPEYRARRNARRRAWRAARKEANR